MSPPGTLAALSLLLAGAGLQAASPRPSTPVPAVPPPVPWTRLELAGSKLFLSAATTVTVSRVPASAVAAVLRKTPPGTGPLRPGGKWVDVVHVASRLPLGKSERATVWLDGHDGAVLQMEKLVEGGRPYWKLRRYFAGGYHEWREAPARKEERRLPRDRWSKHTEKTVRWEAALPANGAVTDSYALLYLVTRFLTEGGGDPLVLHAASRGRLVRLEARVRGRTERRADFAVTWPGGSERRTDRRRLLAVHVMPRWVDDPADPRADTGFLGMRGPLEIFVEPGTRIPCRVEGTVKGAGHLVVRLTRAALHGPPAPSGGPAPQE